MDLLVSLSSGFTFSLSSNARASTVEQVAGFEAQVRELQSIGAKKIFREQISSVASRAQLEGAIDFCREGDMLVVCKLDRLARSVRDLVRIIEKAPRRN
jgi:DNA invertase Pin-like site-specific DNA recombinase